MASIPSERGAPDALDHHPLQPLLAPRSIAIVGASNRSDGFGHMTVQELVRHGYRGRIYPVNPRYDEVQGIACYPSLGELPETPDHAVLCIANERIEAQLEQGAQAGIKAATIFASGYLENDDPARPLTRRLASIARAAGMQVCGGNCLGFRNLPANVHVGIFPEHGLVPGPVAWISHSGTAYGTLTDLDGRVGYALVVSSGQELTTSAADYMDYALAMPQTRCIAIYLEAIRDAERFVAALERAAAQRVPVVILKVGRSEAAARFAITHSGAMVGNDMAYQALFERYGVLRASSMEEMVNIIQLLCYGRPLLPGDLTAILDSGGKRELLMDMVDEVGVPIAAISDATKATLSSHLDPGLEAVNPLDYWGTGVDWEHRFASCLRTLVDDPQSGLGVLSGVICFGGSSAYSTSVSAVARETEKPIALLTDFLRVADLPGLRELNANQVAVLVGERSGLRAIRAAMRYRDWLEHAPVRPPVDKHSETAARWRRRLGQHRVLDEAESMALLSDFGIPTLELRIAESEQEAFAACTEIGFPIAMKTAMPGIAHKSDVGGVKLRLTDREGAAAAYRDLRKRLGPRVLVTTQVTEPGVEMALGTVTDAVARTLLMLSVGGTLIEVLDDKACTLAPTDEREVRQMIAGLRARKILAGIRGRPAADIDALVHAAVRLSALAAALDDVIEAIDVNPLLVCEKGCFALDALVVTRPS